MTHHLNRVFSRLLTASLSHIHNRIHVSRPVGSRFSSNVSKPLAAAVDSRVPIPKDSSDRYIAVFTCKICKHRSAKSFSKRAYKHGVVYVRCPGCSNLHLISDQLGWFGDSPENIEDILLKQGENVHKAELGEDLSEEDIVALSQLKHTKHFD